MTDGAAGSWRAPPPGDDLCDLSARQQRSLLARRLVSARELLTAHLDRVATLNPTVNAVIALDAEVAGRRAAAIDETIASGGDPGPLAGLVTAHKDLAETIDFPTTYGSPLFAGNRPTADSLLVARMKAAGAVAIGKTNVPEWGAGSHTFNPVHGVTRNPYAPDRSAGGSSGGAAVALRCGMVAVADGSDVGGSLRNPAAWNNVVGFRTSARVVPRVGPGNAWSTLPVEGPMARTVDDLALLLGVLAEPDGRDPLNRPLDLPETLTGPKRPPRVAWSPTLGGLPVEDDVAVVLDRFRTVVEDLGWEVVEAEPDFAGADECFVTLRAFGFANGPAGTLDGAALARVKESVQDEVRRGRALTGEEVGAALAEANRLWRTAAAFFDRHDLLIGPVTQLSPFPVGWEYPTEVAGRPMATYLEWMRSNCRISILGLPALSLPAGFTDAGLPVGAQLIGGHWADLDVLRAALALEHATGHGTRGPDLDLLATARGESRTT